MQLPEKCKTQFGRKINWFVVVDKRHAHPGKIKLHHNRPNSLANAAHAASEFRKQRLTFLSINIITKYFALPCKVQKTTKNTSFPDVIPPFCSKSRAVHKEDIVVTKFQLPYQVMQKRSTCSPYQREFILPYPLLLRFPCSLAKKVSNMQHNALYMYPHHPQNHCEDPHTKSSLPSSCRCIKIPVYVNYSCVIAVVCVRILIDAEKLNSKCQVEITLQRIPCSPVHHKRSSIDSAQSIHTSEFQAHCTKRKP